MEYWSLYDFYGNKKRKKAIRGSKLNDNDFHIVVNAWIMNSKGEFLITQRAANKSHPLMWECTGGSALINESSLEAAKREINEELGISVEDSQATLIGRTRRFYKNCPDIFDVWLFKKDIELAEIKVQEEEVNNVMWASKETIMDLFKNKKFEANTFFNKIMNIDEDKHFYYVGFNANNAIFNEAFFNGMITLNPNHEKGNIFYTKEAIKNKDDKFMKNYKEYLLETMEMLSKNNNAIFLAFNKKIKNLLKDNKNYNIVSEKDYDLIDSLNDKKNIRQLLKGKVPVINTKWISKKIDYSTAKKTIESEQFVIQGQVGAGGNNTFFIDNKEKFDKYTELCNNQYFISKYIKHLPVNSTIIVGEYNNVRLPSSVQLIKLQDDSFKYTGGDFIYYQSLNDEVKEKIDNYNNIITNTLSELGYRGILGIDYIIDNDDNVYFMEINPRFQSSSFIISEYLHKYCSTTIAEMHYMAISDIYIGSNYIEGINKSFVNCYNKDDFKEFKYPRIIKNGYYYKNKTSNFRKVYDYSILKNGPFEKRKKDS